MFLFTMKIMHPGSRHTKHSYTLQVLQEFLYSNLTI